MLVLDAIYKAEASSSLLVISNTIYRTMWRSEGNSIRDYVHMTCKYLGLAIDGILDGSSDNYTKTRNSLDSAIESIESCMKYCSDLDQMVDYEGTKMDVREFLGKHMYGIIKAFYNSYIEYTDKHA